MTLSEIPTPALLIERARLERNIQQMHKKAEANRVRLRPHAKTHKCVEIARRQQAEGASRLTVATVQEAEVFAGNGVGDIRIAYSVAGEDRLRRIARLGERTRVSFCVDTMDAARAASLYFSARQMTIDVLVEVDCGHGRCGVRWNGHDSVDFARSVKDLPGLQLTGILTHAGHAYSGPAHEGETVGQSVQNASEEERDRMLTLASRLREANIIQDTESFEISIGSTPSISRFENRSEGGFAITEIRPGNYVFHDAIQVALGVCSLENCALTVLATVVSKHRNGSSDRIFVDAGKKILTTDAGYGTKGYGVIVYNSRRMYPLPHAVIHTLSEEHGWVETHGGSTLEVGDQVRIVPNHACVVANMVDRYYVVDGDEVVDEWRVDARGR